MKNQKQENSLVQLRKLVYKFSVFCLLENSFSVLISSTYVKDYLTNHNG